MMLAIDPMERVGVKFTMDLPVWVECRRFPVICLANRKWWRRGLCIPSMRLLNQIHNVYLCQPYCSFHRDRTNHDTSLLRQ